MVIAAAIVGSIALVPAGVLTVGLRQEAIGSAAAVAITEVRRY